MICIYEEALKDKKIAAKILIPLIEFEFGFRGLDSPEIVQTNSNREQLEAIFKICKNHGWVTSEKIKYKGKNLYFRISKKGFKEIYEIAGMFASKEKNEWARLILERLDKRGGYRRGQEKTEEKVFSLLNKEKNWLSVEEICLRLRLLPSVVREALRLLFKNKKIQRKKVGKTIYWKI